MQSSQRQRVRVRIYFNPEIDDFSEYRVISSDIGKKSLSQSVQSDRDTIFKRRRRKNAVPDHTDVSRKQNLDTLNKIKIKTRKERERKRKKTESESDYPKGIHEKISEGNPTR